MSTGGDWIVIRGTGTLFDGTWLEIPFLAARLTLGPSLTLRPTNGFEQEDERGVAQVWKPEPMTPADILFKVETTYGGSPLPPRILRKPRPKYGSGPSPTLLGMPIVEAEPGTFPPGTEGDIVLGPPEDIVDMLLDDLEEPRPK